MELKVHGKQMDVGDSLQTHVKGTIEELSGKYFNHTAFANITFSREGHGHPRTRAHISIKLGRDILVVADAVEANPYVAFDSAAYKAGKQLRRYKRRLRDHHVRSEKTPERENIKARDYVLAMSHEGAEESDQAGQGDVPAVIADMETAIETLTVADAVMRMELGDMPALLFRNAKHNGLNMVYRRADGHVGWVDPEIAGGKK